MRHSCLAFWMTRLPDSFVCLRGSGAKAVSEAAWNIDDPSGQRIHRPPGVGAFHRGKQKNSKRKRRSSLKHHILPNFSPLPPPLSNWACATVLIFSRELFWSCGPDCTCHSFLSRSEPDLIGFSAPASPSLWTTLSWMMIFLTSRAMLEAPTLSQNLRR